LLFNYYLI